MNQKELIDLLLKFSSIEVSKELKEKREIIENFFENASDEKIKEILYEEFNRISERIFEEMEREKTL